MSHNYCCYCVHCGMQNLTTVVIVVVNFTLMYGRNYYHTNSFLKGLMKLYCIVIYCTENEVTLYGVDLGPNCS